jgi:hypothetical protein
MCAEAISLVLKVSIRLVLNADTCMQSCSLIKESKLNLKFLYESELILTAWISKNLREEGAPTVSFVFQQMGE